MVGKDGGIVDAFTPPWKSWCESPSRCVNEVSSTARNQGSPAKRQEHADLDAAIHTLSSSGYADQMLLQRMKKRKLALKDRIVQLENLLLPDIIA